MSSFPMNGKPRSARILPPFTNPYQVADLLPKTPELPKAGNEQRRLGDALGIREVAQLIGCSPWTVRQTLIPRGLPHFRYTRHGRITFYREQVIRWIERQQQGGQRKP